MTTKFYCWEPENGETQEDESLVEEVCDNPEWAAESHAEESFYAGDPFKSTIVAVRREGESDVRLFDVEVEYSPDFTASERTEPIPRPRDGEYFVVKHNGEIVSK